jgi:adenylate cyclase
LNNPTTRSSPVEGVVAFTDLVGYTEYTALRGDAEALVVLAAQDRIVHDTLPHDARVVKELGDGLLLYFTEPAPAVAACVLLLQRFERAAESGELPLWIRIGLHWGRPTSRGDDLVGHDVNVAARIVDVAAPGELLCSEAAMTAARSNLEGIGFVELGPVVMKGIPQPIELYRAERVDQTLPTGATG